MNEFFAWVISIIGVVLPGFGAATVPSWNGYVEADYVYVAAQTPGTIDDLAVHEGQVVKAGDLLFALSATQQQALAAAAAAQVNVAEANVANLETGGRTDEVAVIRASLDKAKADLSLANANFARSEKLFSQGLIPMSKLDQDRTMLASAQAQVSQLEAQLRVTELPARDAQQLAAEANLAAARANAEKANADLADRRIVAPKDGRIDQVYFVKGELAAAGVPVVSLLPQDALKVKFYLSETDRSAVKLGETLAVSCDGCADGITATVTHFASDPQFTPPVIYSQDERNRLVFLVEATLDAANAVHPGQPVTIGPVK